MTYRARNIVFKNMEKTLYDKKKECKLLGAWFDNGYIVKSPTRAKIIIAIYYIVLFGIGGAIIFHAFILPKLTQ